MMSRFGKPMLSLALLAAVTGAAIALAAISQPATANPAAMTQDDLPTVDTIYENCIKAVGGREAVDNVKTIEAKTTMSMMGQQMGMEQSWSREGGRLLAMPMMGMQMGSDGTTAWIKGGPGQYMLAPEQQAGELEAQTGMFMFMIDFKKFAKDDMQSLEVVGEEAFAEKDCYKLHYTGKDAKEGHVFFDKDSGLPVGFMQQKQAEDGAPGDKSTMLIKDWKEVEGVKFFHRINMEIEPGPSSPSRMMADADGKFRAEIKVDELKVNTLEPDHFALPEEVKALVDAQKADETTTADESSGEDAPEIKLEDLPEDQRQEATKQINKMKGLPDTNVVKQAVSAFEMGMPRMAPERKLFMQYIVQELKKEVASREG